MGGAGPGAAADSPWRFCCSICYVDGVGSGKARCGPSAMGRVVCGEQDESPGLEKTKVSAGCGEEEEEAGSLPLLFPPLKHALVLALVTPVRSK